MGLSRCLIKWLLKVKIYKSILAYMLKILPLGIGCEIILSCIHSWVGSYIIYNDLAKLQIDGPKSFL